MVAEVRAECPELIDVVFIGTPRLGRASSRPAPACTDASLAAREAELSFDDPINIQYTSGTTGFPKGATLSHHNILNNGYFVARRSGYTEQRPGVRAGAVLPLLRHGDGQPRRAPATVRAS